MSWSNHDFSGLGQESTDFIDISGIGGSPKEVLLKAFSQAGFAKKGPDQYKLLPCPKGTHLDPSDPNKLECLECPAGTIKIDLKQLR